MCPHKIRANEKFFDDLLSVLREGGKWGWPAIGQVFTKTDRKLLGKPAAIKQVKEIVSEEYFQKNFGTLNN
jgi:hypothetical protein